MRIGPAVLILLLVACACSSGGVGGVRVANGPAVGGRAPSSGDYRAITIVSAAGKPVRLAEVLGARPALVSFWAPWCEPCLRELPDLERLAKSARPCAMSVVGVAVGETPAAVASFAAANHLLVPQFADESYALADALGQTRVPTTVVFDGAQRVAFVGEGVDRRATDVLSTLLAGDRGLGAGTAATDCGLAMLP